MLTWVFIWGLTFSKLLQLIFVTFGKLQLWEYFFSSICLLKKAFFPPHFISFSVYNDIDFISIKVIRFSFVAIVLYSFCLKTNPKISAKCITIHGLYSPGDQEGMLRTMYYGTGRGTSSGKIDGQLGTSSITCLILFLWDLLYKSILLQILKSILWTQNSSEQLSIQLLQKSRRRLIRVHTPETDGSLSGQVSISLRENITKSIQSIRRVWLYWQMRVRPGM